MKICGYSQIDSVKDGKQTHGVMVHRIVPLSRQGSAGFKSNYIWLSDDLLESFGLKRSDIVECFEQQRDIIIETITENNYTNVASVLII